MIEIINIILFPFALIIFSKSFFPKLFEKNIEKIVTDFFILKLIYYLKLYC